jgi:transcriptional regulatory protein LevR
VPFSAFIERLDLLEASQQVSASARAATATFLAECEREFDVVLGEDNGSLLVTHLAMGLTRLERGEPVTEVPDALATEVGSRRHELDWVRDTLQTIGEQLSVVVPPAEVVYVAAHVQAVLQTSQRDG